MDQIEGFENAIEQTRSIVHGTSPADFDYPTPCPEWNARALVNHIIGVVKIASDAATTGEGDISILEQDNIGADHAASYDAAARTAVDGWKQRGTDGSVKMFIGEMPVPVALHIVTSDVIVHGWDLARATGQTIDWNQTIAEDRLATAKQMLKPEMRGDFFGPEVPAPAGADSMTQLVAFFGRQP